MIQSKKLQIPCVTREGGVVIRKQPYSTAISTRYFAYAGYDNHAQHTLVLVYVPNEEKALGGG